MKRNGEFKRKKINLDKYKVFDFNGITKIVKISTTSEYKFDNLSLS